MVFAVYRTQLGIFRLYKAYRNSLNKLIYSEIDSNSTNLIMKENVTRALWKNAVLWTVRWWVRDLSTFKNETNLGGTGAAWDKLRSKSHTKKHRGLLDIFCFLSLCSWLIRKSWALKSSLGKFIYVFGIIGMNWTHCFLSIFFLLGLWGRSGLYKDLTKGPL